MSRTVTSCLAFAVGVFAGGYVACGSGGSGGAGDGGISDTDAPVGTPGGSVPAPVVPSCTAAGGTAKVSAPEPFVVLKDRYEEGWLAAPAVVDLDGDGTKEIVLARESKLVAFRPDGSVLWKVDGGSGRMWASPVVADFRGDAQLEVVVAARKNVTMVDAKGAVLSGFPVTFEDEIRGVAAADVDGDGKLDIVASVGKSGPTDVVAAWRADGTSVSGFPPVAKGASGCDAKCYFAGCYDQNVALADLDGDGKADVVAPHDNAYASFFKGTGAAFDANAMFPAKKTPGVRYMFDLAEAKKGFAENEDTALQAHFTNTAPTIADVDGDGTLEIVMLGSVQNASQDDRKKGVGLWVVKSDASRLAGWETPFHAKDYLAGLEDPGDNVVGATNQVAVADLDSTKPGLEMIFAGFDGKIHAVTADKKEIFAVAYTTSKDVLTGGVVVGDLSADGVPEIVFTTYSTKAGQGSLFVLDAGGNVLHKVALPTRGSMALPTLADVDGDGTVDVTVSLKDAEDKVESGRVYRVPGSKTNCLLWPTARHDLLRSAHVPSR